jgi:hypothetical protein
MSTKDTSHTTRLRRKMAEIYSSYYYNVNDTNVSGTPTGATSAFRPEQTSQSSGEVTILRQQGCSACRNDNLKTAQTVGGLTIPYNERVPGGR